MHNNSELAVVIPIFNEEKNIISLIHDWQVLFTEKKITPVFIIINDGSTDKSLSLLTELRNRIPFFTILSHHNQGHGPSLLKGYQEANTYNWIFQIDSDHEYETAAFIDLWNHRDQYDLLLGERNEKNASIVRSFISFVSRLTVKVFYGKRIRDVNSPYRLMRGSILKSVIEKIPRKSFAPNILITGFFVLKQMRIYTVPIKKRKNKFSKKSKMNFYFTKGCLLSIFQTIRFRFKL